MNFLNNLGNNKKSGFVSSVFLAVTVVLFALALIINYPPMSYFVCLFMSWSFVIMVCGFYAEADKDKNIFTLIALMFAVIYSVLINIAYFTQLAFVLKGNLSDELMNVFAYERFGFMFAIDILGYGLMGLSTFFLGLSFKPESKKDKWLKGLLFGHGLFFLSCLIVPMLNVFNAGMEGGELMGRLLLIFWCAYFLPIAVLSALKFIKKENKPLI